MDRRVVLLSILLFLPLMGMALIPLAKDAYLEHRMFPSRISFELQDAPLASTPDGRVHLWLVKNRAFIADAERRFKISRVAIAGLIAYEGLVDVHLSRYVGLADWSGPGKVHYKEYRFAEGDPLSKQVEDRHLLPTRSMAQRERLLQTAQWSALYIAASMRLLADIVTKRTGHHVDCNAGALATLASAWTARSAARYFQRHEGERFLFTDNFAGNWVLGREHFLTRAVGYPKICVQHYHNRKA